MNNMQLIFTGNSKLSKKNTSKTDKSIIILDSDDDEIDEIKYHVVELPEGTIKNIPDYYMASGYPPDSHTQLRSKTRIIAKRRQEDLFPFTVNVENGPIVYLYKNDDSAFYAGMISDHRYMEDDCWKYLVFFDDGHCQYVASKNIRVVFGTYGTKYVHENARQFYDYYFNAVNKCKLPEIQCTINNKVRVFSNGQFELATIAECKPDQKLVRMHFKSTNHVEWIYIGSPRFERIWKSIVQNNKLKRYHSANTTLIEVSSDSEEEDDEYKSPQKQPLPSNAKESSQKIFRIRPEMLIDDYKPSQKLDRQHVCQRACVREFERNRQIFTFDPLKRPLLAGWTRKNTSRVCYYIAPCGRSLNTIDAVYKYLRKTKSKLSIGWFTFSINIDCMTEIRSVSNNGQTIYLNKVKLKITFDCFDL